MVATIIATVLGAAGSILPLFVNAPNANFAPPTYAGEAQRLEAKRAAEAAARQKKILIILAVSVLSIVALIFFGTKK